MGSQHCDILQIVPTLETGGAESMVVHLSGELMRAGVQTGVVSLFDTSRSGLERALRSDGIPVWSLRKRPGLDLAMIGRLRKLLRSLRPAVIHTHLSALRYAIPAVIGVTHPPRIVHTIHRVAERDSEFGLRWLQRWCLRQTVAVIAVSEEVASSCIRIYGGLNISVIPNGIPLRDYASSVDMRAEVRRALGIDPGCFTLCCVAHLRAVKNHKILLEAFAGIIEQTGAHLLLVGDGELRSELEALAGTLRITRQVQFLGEREDVAGVLAASDAFVLASFSEGTPLSVLEAMATGLPIIATTVGGLPELVRSGAEGLLVPPGNVVALRAALTRLVLDSESRRVMSQAARKRVAERYDAAVMASSYLSAYKRLGMNVCAGAI